MVVKEFNNHLSNMENKYTFLITAFLMPFMCIVPLISEASDAVY